MENIRGMVSLLWFVFLLSSEVLIEVEAENFKCALGDLIYLDIPKNPTIIVSSARAAFDLLEKRSDIYSDRPISVMHQMCDLI